MREDIILCMIDFVFLGAASLSAIIKRNPLDEIAWKSSVHLTHKGPSLEQMRKLHKREISSRTIKGDFLGVFPLGYSEPISFQNYFYLIKLHLELSRGILFKMYFHRDTDDQYQL